MSANESPDAGRASPPSRSILALMAAVLHIALVVFVWGVMSFVLDRDVIAVADAGPLLGPVVVAVTAALVFWLVVRRGPTGFVARALFALVGSVVVGSLVGAIVLSFGSGGPFAFPVYFGTFILSPFTLALGPIAALVVGVFAFFALPGQRG